MVVKKTPRQARVRARRKVVQFSKSNGAVSQEVRANPKNKKTQIVVQEIKFARLLANSDKRVRDKVLKNLKKWLTVRSKSSFAFTEADFMRLWKGLFYCMWMSDKPLIQEELAESLSNIVHCFDSVDVILLYTKCTLKSLAIEWFGIDQYRLDKFAMLVRRILRQTFCVCRQKSWENNLVAPLSKIIEDLLIDKAVAFGFGTHIVEIFWEELAKISGADIPESVVTKFTKPFVVYLTQMVDERQIKHVMKHIFRYLIFQSDVGIDYAHKFEAWRQAGFPCGTINAMEKVELPDNEIESNTLEVEDISESEDGAKKPLDPRAGRVDVELPQLPFSAEEISALLLEHRFHPTSTAKSRRQLIHLAGEFQELAQGKMPLGIKEVRVPIKRPAETNPKKAALRLLEFEEELYSDANKGRRKRQKLYQSENRREESIAKQNLLKDEKEGHINILQQTTFHRKVCSKDGTSVFSDSPNNKATQSPKLKVQKATSQAVNKGKSISPIKLRKLKKHSSGNWDVSENISALFSSPCQNKAAVNTFETEFMQNNTQPHKNSQLNNNVAFLSHSLKKLSAETMKAVDISKDTSKETPKSNSKKRVKIVLQRNTAQHTSEYIQQIRKSPAIPFDANKKPTSGVLKASPIPSPVNPFYKKKYK